MLSPVNRAGVDRHSRIVRSIRGGRPHRGRKDDQRQRMNQTAAPRGARSRAVARPRPRAPPVTTATWSRHSIMLPFHMSDQHAGQLFYPDTAHAGGGTAMEMRVFGRTGMQLSVLGFGCGAVGGLMVRGDPVDQERTVARATAAGVNYFDTAVQYGNGESERNLGRVLQRLKPANVAVGTKVRLPSGDFGRIADAVAKSLEGSLARLRLEAAGKRSASDRYSVMWCPRSSGCVSRARHVFLGSPQSATPRRCIR